ncbi:MAG: SAM-dependent methyltransferase [Chloroflexota bacterium]|nr:SAM-dependent methyltransferase [Chloroflexota bacterium]
MDPGRDPRWDGSEARLVEAIRDEIASSTKERITFARFMQCALTEPGLGYYATSELRPTRSGDFLTAPELHPFFGRCIGRLVAAAWESAGAPRTYRVHEYGGGRGTLRDNATEGLRFDVEWTRADLPDRSDDVSGPADLILANEYLDALPVHRLLQEGELHEAYVGWDVGWFREVLDRPSTPELAAHLEADGVELHEGQRAEICLAAPRWIVAAARELAPGRILLVIDYGHDSADLYGPRRMAGSLLTYREHEVADDPFSAVGHSDITAHIDITALERAASDAGLELVGSTTQAQFLGRLGLGQLLADLGRQPGMDPGAYMEARSAVARLLDPKHLGGFRVLAWARPAADGSTPSLPGFADTP